VLFLAALTALFSLFVRVFKDRDVAFLRQIECGDRNSIFPPIKNQFVIETSVSLHPVSLSFLC
jgi:hypothetical protein